MAESAKDTARELAEIVKAGGQTIEDLALVGGQPLPPAPDRANIGATTGIGRLKTAPAAIASATNGIASPLTESARTLHSTQNVSSDGLFVWSVPATITMLDAEGRTVGFVYAAPA